MKKYFSITLCLIMLFLTACAGNQPVQSETEETVVSESASSEAVSEEIKDETTEETTQEEIIIEGHYEFKPKVCSVYTRELFGDDMCDAWFNLVDAVMEGKDTFECKDQHTYDWVMGQFPDRYFPPLTEIIDYAYDRGNCVHDGIATFTYKVSQEEAKEIIDNFSREVEDILNTSLQDDYSDMEKALALYKYFSDTYEYDYDTFYETYETYVDYTSSYRFLQGKIGICCEVSRAYSYLLMQAGVDATTIMGGDHEWSYVRINGKNYHIDPTFVLTDKDFMAYFMMNDEQREFTGYSKDSFVVTSNYYHEVSHPNYIADDDAFSPIWDYVFESFSHKDHIIYCPYESGDQEWSVYEFDYKDFSQTSL